MAFFEFPHTRTYDSDLGWLIRHVHDLILEFGSLDHWRNEHETEYQQLYNQVQGLAQNLIDVIVPWDPGIEYRIYSIVEYLGDNYIAIQDVPVGVNITDPTYWALANTTVAQINAIANDVSGIKSELAGQPTLPLIGRYMGDYLCNSGDSPQSLCMVGDLIYTFSPYSTDGGMGELRIFDRSTNRMDSQKQIKMGHANSACYCPDNNSFYIAPVFEYAGGAATKNYKVYKYDATFTTLAEFTLGGADIQSVSYDWATGKLYALSYLKDVYLLDPATNDYTFVENIDYALSGISGHDWNQDWAIYNNEWILSEPGNNILTGCLGRSWFHSYMCPRIESMGTRFLGELEGWEYNEDGRLIAMFTTLLVDNYRDGYVVELSAATPLTRGPIGRNRRSNITLSLSDTTQAQFQNDTHEIKSLRQLGMLNTEAVRVGIQGTPDEGSGNISIVKPIVINVNAGANWRTGQLRPMANYFGLYGSGTITVITANASLIFVQTGCRIVLAGSVVIDNPASCTKLINSDTGGDDVTVLNTYSTTNPMTINNTPYKVGRYNLGYKRPIQILSGDQDVTIPAGSQYVEFSINYTNGEAMAGANVILQAQTTSTSVEGIFYPVVTARSPTGFTARLWRTKGQDATNAGTNKIHWVAMA